MTMLSTPLSRLLAGATAIGAMLLYREAVAQVAPASRAATDTVAPANVTFDEALGKEFDAYVGDALHALGVPGAAIALIQGGEIVHLRAFGVRGQHGAATVDLETRFMIGSVTKSMTATMTATLVDDGLVDWDEPAVQLLPGFELSNPESSPLVRIRDLMDHTSGVARFDSPLFLESLRPLDLLAAVADYPVVAPPGQTFQYQNQMFALGGFAVVRAAGYSYGDRALLNGYARLMQRRVFDPIGMPRTTLLHEVAVDDSDHAVPHTFDPVERETTELPIGLERFAEQVAPAGAVWSSIRDMARYAVLHVRAGLNPEGVRVVSAKQLLETHTAHITLAEGVGYGLGWSIHDSSGVKVVAHDGGTAGFSARVLVLPDLDAGLVILTNRWGAGAFLDAVQQYATRVLFGGGPPDIRDALAEEQALRADLQTVADLTTPVTRASVAGYLGEYAEGVSVHFRNDAVVIRTAFGEMPFRAVPGFEDTFLGAHNVGGLLAVHFTTGERGQITLTFGVADIETESIAQPVELVRRTRGTPRAQAAAPAFEVRELCRLLAQHGVRPFTLQRTLDHALRIKVASHDGSR